MRLILLALAACASDVTVAVDSPVIDPKLPGAALSVAVDGRCSGEVVVEGADGRTTAPVAVAAAAPVVAVTVEDALGPLDPGPARVVVTCDDGRVATADVHVVRAALAEVDLLGADNVEVAFHKRDLATYAVTVIDMPELRADAESLSGADADSGTPLPPPEPWLDPHAPPWGGGEPGPRFNLPAAYVAGGTVELAVALADTAVSARGHPVDANPEGFPLRAVPDGYTLVDEHAVAGASLPDTLGLRTLELVWRFEADDGTGFHTLPGAVHTRHRVYVVAGHPHLVDGTAKGLAPGVPWVGMLHDLEPAIAGLPADDFRLMDAIRDHIHYDDDIHYNPSDSTYGWYQGPYITWEYQVSELSMWLDRSDGVDLWCHSLACLLSVSADTVGVDASYLVIGTGFRTNTARPAGDAGFTSWYFNAHGIATPDGGSTVWDAAIDFKNPEGEGVISPKGFALDDYLDMLTNDRIEVKNRGYCYVE